ncbi:MAG: type III-B CRISPR module RAMP protein Cmr1 [Candidatus Heimdallarchaeota archaeon]|nr:type III-B CRISPR module RAMP protein Cmr1 [Candidatus Heimdallarchaeota archaeon]MDH5645960.1 type III-B CRISPR module RAMP protein Cmr1 [Candidatus Heimdallarchaeota archaeon]
MKSLNVTLELNTPFFSKGSGDEIEFRLSSFKGVLRYWWRAIYNDYTDLKQLRNDEAEIFGSSDQNIGQSKIFLSSKIIKKQTSNMARFSRNSESYGIKYLGYTFPLPQNNWTKYFKEFVVEIKIYHNLKGEEVKFLSLINALKAFNYFGGFGARSRRGFGSFNIVKITDERDQDVFTPANSKHELIEQIKVFCKDINLDKKAKMPQYSALSNHTKIYLLESNTDPYELMNSIGVKFQLYRSWGRKDKNFQNQHMVNKNPAEQNFKSDHSLVKSFYNNYKINQHGYPNRIIFGLPHNYFTSKQIDNIDFKKEYPNFEKLMKSLNLKITSDNVDRRASPLMIKIYKLKSEYVAVCILIKADFIPDNNRLIYTGKFKIKPNTRSKEIGKIINENASTIYSGVDWNVITTFIEGNYMEKGIPKKRKRFPDYQKVY